MRAHILQHVPFEGPGSIGHWLKARQAEVTTTRLFESTAFPAVAEIDLLVIMGGPMSINDEDTLPWLAPEKRFIGEAIAAGLPVIGICLGAQLMAASQGARVYPGPEKEIGWFPVEAIEHCADAFVFPPTFMAFHWHGETFELPTHAVHLARSAGCTNQAFQIGERAIGLQFHLETTPESAADIIDHSRHELVAERYIQSEAELLSADAGDYAGLNRLMVQVLNYLVRDC
ncbi:type 1 glutamine amidotransferase [Marinimicrobium alkaliphilum]|uniref:type 1 glutamine amidotransferase n=1 Tax=Marinimicrobium alkaliphilum TaxID=2202654 RepID=UPI000DB98AF0|nr:type 1 glutamine amidotransferase [Marinimicrobium alkaliphilum]